MTIYALDHVQLSMPEGWEDMARAFYVDILGLSAQPKSDRHNKRSGVWFTTGTLKLHLSVDPEFRACHKAYPGLLVNGVEELADRCAAAGYSIAADEPIEGYRHVVVSDPFGNRLKLIEPLKLKVMMFQ